MSVTDEHELKVKFAGKLKNFVTKTICTTCRFKLRRGMLFLLVKRKASEGLF